MSALPASISFGGRTILLKYHKLRSGDGCPPNSLEALEDVLSNGAEVIELDIRLAADDRYVLLHDATLQRETTGTGPVRRISSERFTELRLKDADARGATFDEAVARLLAVDRPIKLQIDLKETQPMAGAGLETLARTIETLWRNPNIRIVVGCLADWNLRALRRRLRDVAVGVDFAFFLDAPIDEGPQLPTRVNAYGYLDDHPLGFYPASLPAAEYLADRFESMLALVDRPAEFYIRKELLSMALRDGFNPVAFIHDRCPDTIVDIWTIDPDTPEGERHLLEAVTSGADQITTNMPRLTHEVIHRARPSSSGGRS